MAPWSPTLDPLHPPILTIFDSASICSLLDSSCFGLCLSFFMLVCFPAWFLLPGLSASLFLPLNSFLHLPSCPSAIGSSPCLVLLTFCLDHQRILETEVPGWLFMLYHVIYHVLSSNLFALHWFKQGIPTLDLVLVDVSLICVAEYIPGTILWLSVEIYTSLNCLLNFLRSQGDFKQPPALFTWAVCLDQHWRFCGSLWFNRWL